MPNSPRMLWPYPGQNQDPWYDSFESMVAAMDAASYAHREDRGIMLAKGGLFTFDALTGALSWDEALDIYSPITGYKGDLPAGSVTLAEGQFLYVNLTRWPLDNVTLGPQVAGTVPNTNDAYVIAIRRGSDVYFRTGERLANGEHKSIFGSSFGASGQKLISYAWSAARASHDSDTPYTVGAFAFNPSDYQVAGTTIQLSFRAVAANGNPGITGHVKLRNASDGEDVGVLDYTTTALAKDEITLVIGTGAGQIWPAERIYEVIIYLGAPKVDPMDSIQLYSAEMRVTATIV